MKTVSHENLKKMMLFTGVTGIFSIYVTNLLFAFSSFSWGTVIGFLVLATLLALPVPIAIWFGMNSFFPWIYDRVRGGHICIKAVFSSFVIVYSVINMSAIIAGGVFSIYNGISKSGVSILDVIYYPFLVAIYLYNIFSLWCAPFIGIGLAWYWHKLDEKNRV